MNEQINIAFGIGTKNRNGEWLEVMFPIPNFKVGSSVAQSIGSELGWNQTNQTIEITKDQINTFDKNI